MEFHTQQIAKKKRNDIANTVVSHTINHLPDDVMVDILCRLPTKQLSTTACVSKTWFRLIVASCFPKIATGISYLGLILRVETILQHPRVTFCKTDSMRVHRFGSAPIPNSCSKILPFKVSAKSLIDCCNGLLLFCHRNKAETKSLYYYHVLNSVTKQCVTVPKPGKTALNMYAALAYEPCESSYYKIVRFQGLRCLNIYSSETKKWKTVKFHLDSHVTEAQWLEQSLYFKGAIYRISMSGHLLRFVVDEEVSVNNQAQAIDLPEIAKRCPRGCVGLNNDQIHFAVYDKPDLCIWVLEHQLFRSNIHTFKWNLKCRFSCTRIHTMENKYCVLPMAFHPYTDSVYVGTSSQWGSSLFCLKPSSEAPYYEGRVREYHKAISYIDGHLNWDHVFAYPMLQSYVPFASGFAMTTHPDGMFLP
ncbi:hypothetical protein FNV43_RR24274 [Rhamnella rubrinervis]|uniref:F-box domain-containing protein n=1 Tax=Rhamnella rubrinervis TaxID=2594499 RepID=A0A8K0DL69_9ROSA|nr:hypothetical protein FNV43_RR24274 [Rhamnella rubrinervis]